MKIRIKFSKQGQMKFIGHLDIMRYFQKVMRRAHVDIAYSEGFSPHQKMSFAAPLGVGLTSLGEYFDIEVNSSSSSEEMIERINDCNVEGIEVLAYNLLPDDAKNCMAVIAAADYMVIGENKNFTENVIAEFYNQEQILILKKTKKSEKEVDIKPMLNEIKICDRGIFMKVAQGSANNLKPDLVMSALYSFTGKEMPQLVQYERLEMYLEEEGKLVALDSIGGPIA